MTENTESKSAWLKDIEVIGWDLDGTLYPPGSIPYEAIEKEKRNQVARMNGWDEQRTAREYEKVYMQLGSHTKTLTSFGVNGEKFFVDLWDSLALENYINKDEKVVKLIEMVEKKGLRQFVLSNSNRVDQVERKLKLIGIDPGSFEFLLSTVGMQAVKPESRPFLEAVHRLGVEVSSILYIGDREGTDVMGAKRVGMRTCLVWGTSELADISCPTVYDVGTIFS